MKLTFPITIPNVLQTHLKNFQLQITFLLTFKVTLEPSCLRIYYFANDYVFKITFYFYEKITKYDRLLRIWHGWLTM